MNTDDVWDPLVDLFDKTINQDPITPMDLARAFRAALLASSDERTLPGLCVDATPEAFGDLVWESKEVEDSYRMEVIRAGVEIGIIIGIGCNRIIVAHDFRPLAIDDQAVNA